MKKLILLAIAMCLVFAWGCSKKVKTEPEVVVVEEKEVVVEEVVTDPMAVYKAEYDALPVSHTVTKGECLWWISEYKHVYNDPFMWPLIYKANRDQIKNPDLIYPGQQFDVPRYGFDLEEVKGARKELALPGRLSSPVRMPWCPLKCALHSATASKGPEPLRVYKRHPHGWTAFFLGLSGQPYFSLLPEGRFVPMAKKCSECEASAANILRREFSCAVRLCRNTRTRELVAEKVHILSPDGKSLSSR